jgi:chloride channel protein, CIC family
MMSTDPKPDVKGADGQSSLLALALLAPIVGAGAGIVGAGFRLALEHADGLRNGLIALAPLAAGRK